MAKEDLQKLIDTAFKEEEVEIADLAKKIHSQFSKQENEGDFSMLVLVESLSTSLTSQDVETRLKGTALLCHYLHE